MKFLLRPFRRFVVKAHVSRLLEVYYNTNTASWEFDVNKVDNFFADYVALLEVAFKYDKFDWDKVRSDNLLVNTNFGTFDNFTHWLSRLTYGITEAQSSGLYLEAGAYRKLCRSSLYHTSFDANKYYWETVKVNEVMDSLYQSLSLLLLRKDILTFKGVRDADDTIMDRELSHIFPDIISVLETLVEASHGKAGQD